MQPCNFKAVFNRLDLLIPTFDHLSYKTYDDTSNVVNSGILQVYIIELQADMVRCVM